MSRVRETKTAAPIVKPSAVVLSYLRFSHPSQKVGDSIRRQLTRTDDWANRRGLRIADANRFRDEGVSAFRGRHKATGVLASILKVVKAGALPQGSYLLIENLDRLTREEVFDAVDLVMGIIKSGLTIVTLDDDREYNREAVNENPMLITMLVMELSRGNRESKRKSDLIGSAWRRKKSVDAVNGTVITEAVPSWLNVVGGKIIADANKVKVIQEIYEFAHKGRGSHWITRYLNETTPTITDRSAQWSSTYVLNILQSRAVLGEYQPTRLVYDAEGNKGRLPDGKPIEGYYPSVIEPSVFYAVQKAIDERRGTGGQQSDAVVNFWKGIIFDPIGNPIVSKTQPNWRRNYIYGSLDGKGSATLTQQQRDDYGLNGKSLYFPANEFDYAVFFRVLDFKAIADSSPSNNVPDERITVLDNSIIETDGKLTMLLKAVKAKPSATLITAIDDLEIEKASYVAERRDLLAAESGAEKSITELMAEWLVTVDDIRKDKLTADQRLTLRAAIRRHVKRLDCIMIKDGWQDRVASLRITLTPQSAEAVGEPSVFLSFAARAGGVVEWLVETD